MNFRQAFSWLEQPGIKAIMPTDRQTRDAMKQAITALRKQIPMEVTDIHVDEYYCPACGAENCTSDYRQVPKYCTECGQALYQEI